MSNLDLKPEANKKHGANNMLALRKHRHIEKIRYIHVDLNRNLDQY